MKHPISFILSFIIFNAFAQQNPEVIYLWPNGAPGFESMKDTPERTKDWWVKDIHNPSITLFKPENPNGSFVLICPGGGFRELVFDEEGSKAALFFNELGVTAAVLKYRLFRSDTIYNREHPKQDISRAMRLIRSKASEWEIDAARIGVMGFSAGGEVVNSIAFIDNPGNPNSNDPIERQNANPNFNIQIYPGPLGVPKDVSANPTPAFLLTSNNDKCCSGSVINILEAYRKVNADVEVHIYSMGDHGFNMGDRSKYKTIGQWPDRLADWLIDKNFFQKESDQ